MKAGNAQLENRGVVIPASPRASSIMGGQLGTPRERAGSASLMMRPRNLTPTLSPAKHPAPGISEASGDHFVVSGKQYRRKRPRVDLMAYQAEVNTFREDPQSFTPIAVDKMELLESNCVWKGADVAAATEKEDGSLSIKAKDLNRFLGIAEVLNHRLDAIGEIGDMGKDLGMASHLENEKALAILHRCDYDTEHASFRLASAAGAGLETQFLRRNNIEQSHSRRTLRGAMGAGGGNSKFSASGNAKGKGKVGYDEARKTWKNWISRTRKMLGITIKKDDTEYSLRDLKALEQEVALLPSFLVKPGSVDEKYVSDFQTLHKTLQERIGQAYEMTALAQDVVSGQRKGEFTSSFLRKMLKDSKRIESLVPSYAYIRSLVAKIDEWKKKYHLLLQKESVSILHYQALLRDGEAFPVSVPEVNQVSLRIQEAEAQGLRIRRMFPAFWEFGSSHHGGARRGAPPKAPSKSDPMAADAEAFGNAKPSLESVEEVLQLVSSIGIDTEELLVIKNAMRRTRMWIQKVKRMQSSTSTGSRLKGLSALLQESKALPISVAQYSKQLNDALGDATEWMKKIKSAIPTQKKTRSQRGGNVSVGKTDLNKANLNMLKQILAEAEEFMSESNDGADTIENIRDIVQEAEEWMEEATAAIKDKTMDEADMETLLVEGQQIPVHMDEVKYLDTEILRRDWEERAKAAIRGPKYLTVDACTYLIHELVEIRSHLPEDCPPQSFSFDGEKEIAMHIKKADEWSTKVSSIIDSKSLIFDEKVTVEEVTQLLTELKTIPVDLSELGGKLAAIKVTSVDLATSVKKLLADMLSEKKKRKSQPPWPLNKVGADAVNVVGGKEVPEVVKSGVELKTLEKALDEIKKCRIGVIGEIEIEEEVDKAANWLKRARSILPKAQRKSKSVSKPTMEDVENLCKESAGFAVVVDLELQQIQKEMLSANLWIERAKELIEESNAAMSEVLSKLPQVHRSNQSTALSGSGEITEEAVHVQYFEDYEELHNECTTSVVVATEETSLVKYRIGLMKWFQKADSIRLRPEAFTKGDAKGLMTRYEKLIDEDADIFGEGGGASLADGWRIHRHAHLEKQIREHSLKSDAIEQEMNAYLSMKPGALKPPLADLEGMVSRAKAATFLNKSLFGKLKTEYRKAIVLDDKMRNALTGEKLTLGKVQHLLRQQEKLCVLLPTTGALEQEMEKAIKWDEKVRASGLEEGTASIEYLKELEREGSDIRIILDNLGIIRETVTQYCLCGNTTEGIMIGCEYCDNWFHIACVDVAEEVHQDIDHICPRCNIRVCLRTMAKDALSAMSCFLSGGGGLQDSPGASSVPPVCIPHEVEVAFTDALDEHFPHATSVSRVKEGSATSVTLEKFSAWVTKVMAVLEILVPNIPGADTPNFDEGDGQDDALAQFSVDGVNGVHGVRAKDADVENLILEGYETFTKENLPTNSSLLLFQMVSATLELHKYGSYILRAFPPRVPLSFPDLCAVVKVMNALLKKYQTPYAKFWLRTHSRVALPFQRLKARAEKAKRDVRRWTHVIGDWFIAWDAWHAWHANDDAVQPDAPPAFKGRVETIKLCMVRSRSVPIDLKSELQLLQEKLATLETYLEKDAQYTRAKKPKRRAPSGGSEKKQSTHVEKKQKISIVDSAVAQSSDGASSILPVVADGSEGNNVVSNNMKVPDFKVGAKLYIGPGKRECKVVSRHGESGSKYIVHYENSPLENEIVDLETALWIRGRKRKTSEENVKNTRVKPNEN